MPTLSNNLVLDRCPHCRVDQPLLALVANHESKDHAGHNGRWWGLYSCRRCGGAVVASAKTMGNAVPEVIPSPSSVSDAAVPERARAYLQQAGDTLHAPAGSIMLSAGAVDDMLKAKNYKDGSPYTRIEQAAEARVLTPEMSRWAHDVRLDANDQRHADERAALPTPEDARKCLDFALALAEFMYILPARVQRGIASAQSTR
jgi:hypothetical protein